MRRVGLEFEFAGVGVAQAARIVQRLYGGQVDAQSPFVQKVVGTTLGDFAVEIDTSILKERKYEGLLCKLGLAPDKAKLERALLGFFSTIVPHEVSTPPVPFDRLHELDRLRDALRKAGALGTRHSLRYAFGFHINIEMARKQLSEAYDVLRAFVLLFSWIRRRLDIDVVRRLSPYIVPFPDVYVEHLCSQHPPSDGEFIGDYLRYNPTRNRPLDLLPVLAFFDEQRVAREAHDARLVKPRPAYHFRLPNCLLDEPDWSLRDEWQNWCLIEHLAADRLRLEDFSRKYREAERRSFKPFFDRWPKILEQQLAR